ncbi:MAG: hypothetical protein ABEJ25_03435 [Candidatus Bipolaricaulia bacterium]
MDRIVKKFGGTSLRTEERIRLAVEKVVGDLERGRSVIVVVSAMGKDGDPYATDTLIGLMEDVSSEIDPLKQDLMMSCGEVISASLFSHYLDDAGYDSVPMTGYQAGIFTDDEFGDANILEVDSAGLEKYLNQGRPVVLAGFQGRTIKGEVTTLGRGGSDTTALRVGGAVDADLVEMYTDVPGVAVADPGLVEDPPFFSNISRDALRKLVVNGSNVVHPQAVSSAQNYDVPISVRSYKDERRETIIDGKTSSDRTPLGIAVMEGCGLVEEPSLDPENTSKAEVVSVNIKGNGSKPSILLKEVGGELGDYDPEQVSLVTAVPTIPGRTNELVNKTVDAIDKEKYVGVKTGSDGVQFVVEPGEEAEVVREIYRVFY